VLRRDDPFGEVRWFDIDPCYVFHVANAYDSADGKSIVLQAVRYPELWRENGGFEASAVLWNWTLRSRCRKPPQPAEPLPGKQSARCRAPPVFFSA